MADNPELYWKIRIEEKGKSARFEFLTRVQIDMRRRLGQLIPGVMEEENAYVRIGTANYQLLSDWRRSRRGKAGRG